MDKNKSNGELATAKGKEKQVKGGSQLMVDLRKLMCDSELRYCNFVYFGEDHEEDFNRVYFSDYDKEFGAIIKNYNCIISSTENLQDYRAQKNLFHLRIGALYREGTLYMEKGEFDRAVDLYEQLIEEIQHNRIKSMWYEYVDSYIKLGKCYIEKREEPEKIEGCYMRAESILSECMESTENDKCPRCHIYFRWKRVKWTYPYDHLAAAAGAKCPVARGCVFKCEKSWKLSKSTPPVREEEMAQVFWNDLELTLELSWCIYYNDSYNRLSIENKGKEDEKKHLLRKEEQHLKRVEKLWNDYKTAEVDRNAKTAKGNPLADKKTNIKLCELRSLCDNSCLEFTLDDRKKRKFKKIVTSYLTTRGEYHIKRAESEGKDKEKEQKELADAVECLMGAYLFDSRNTIAMDDIALIFIRNRQKLSKPNHFEPNRLYISLKAEIENYLKNHICQRIQERLLKGVNEDLQEIFNGNYGETMEMEGDCLHSILINRLRLADQVSFTLSDALLLERKDSEDKADHKPKQGDNRGSDLLPQEQQEKQVERCRKWIHLMTLLFSYDTNILSEKAVNFVDSVLQKEILAICPEGKGNEGASSVSGEEKCANIIKEWLREKYTKNPLDDYKSLESAQTGRDRRIALKKLQKEYAEAVEKAYLDILKLSFQEIAAKCTDGLKRTIEKLEGKTGITVENLKAVMDTGIETEKGDEKSGTQEGVLPADAILGSENGLRLLVNLENRKTEDSKKAQVSSLLSGSEKKLVVDFLTEILHIEVRNMYALNLAVILDSETGIEAADEQVLIIYNSLRQSTLKKRLKQIDDVFYRLDWITQALELKKLLIKLYNRVLRFTENSIVNINEIPVVVGHYTKMENLTKILAPEKISKQWLSNLFYMNDPREGRIMIDLLKRTWLCESANKSGNPMRPEERIGTMVMEEYYSSQIKCNYVYMGCFTGSMDNLTMWDRYGGNGKGAYLKINAKDTFDEKQDLSLGYAYISDMETSYDHVDGRYALYQVTYYPDAANGGCSLREDIRQVSERVTIALDHWEGETVREDSEEETLIAAALQKIKQLSLDFETECVRLNQQNVTEMNETFGHIRIVYKHYIQDLENELNKMIKCEAKKAEQIGNTDHDKKELKKAMRVLKLNEKQNSGKQKRDTSSSKTCLSDIRILRCLIRKIEEKDPVLLMQRDVSRIMLKMDEKLNMIKENLKISGEYSALRWRSYKERIVNTIMLIIDQARFLIKSDYYQDEKEYRVIKYSSNPKCDIGSDGIPHIYIEMDKPIRYEEVCLGPKVTAPESVGSYIMDLKRYGDDGKRVMEDIKVRKSVIPFQ